MNNLKSVDKEYLDALDRMITVKDDLLEACELAYKTFRQFKHTTNESIIVAEKIQQVILKSKGTE